MEIYVEKDDRIVEKEFSGTVRELLAILGVNPETVLIVKDGALVTEEDVVDDAKKVELLSVISGG